MVLAGMDARLEITDYSNLTAHALARGVHGNQGLHAAACETLCKLKRGV